MATALDGDLVYLDEPLDPELSRMLAMSPSFWQRSPLDAVVHAYEYLGDGPYLAPVCRGVSARRDRAEWDIVPHARYPRCQVCKSDLALRRSKVAT